MFAPPALYDMNDIDGDGVEDYLDTRELTFRDDRLTGLVVMAYDPGQQRGLALGRDDKPTFDSHPERSRGQQGFVQNTDIGSLGLTPTVRSSRIWWRATPSSNEHAPTR